MKILVRKHQYPSGSVISEVNEHVVPGAALQDLSRPFALHCFRIASQHRQEILWGDILAGVVLQNPLYTSEPLGLLITIPGVGLSSELAMSSYIITMICSSGIPLR